MRFSHSALVAFAVSAAAAAPREASWLVPRAPQAAAAPPAGGCKEPVTLDATTNVWTKYKLWANSVYSAEIEGALSKLGDNVAAAKQVEAIGTFVWLDSIKNIEKIDKAVAGVPCDSIVGLVIYDLPGRDCAAKASNGELPTGQLDRYKKEYIDPIAAKLKQYPNVAFALVIEPDSLPNLVTNIKLDTCKNSAEDYRAGVAYALKTLNLPNVVMYLDAGHGGWLGWEKNLKPGAEELAKAFKAADSPKQLRGIATNVAGWNQWDLSPGEFSSAPDGKYNKAQNEKTYVELLGAELKTAGAPFHAIVDTGRNGKSGLRKEWGDWCNVKGAGLGIRPRSIPDSDFADAFVWVKPPGESDGTSDEKAKRFDSFCGKEDSFKPMPEAGTFSPEYFTQLLTNANPPFGK